MPNDTSKPSPFAHVPKADPNPYAPYQAFRETFLAEIHDPEENEAFRIFGKLQHDYAFTSLGRSDVSWLDDTAHGLQAVAADLRHLRRVLAVVKKIHDEGEREDDEDEAKRHDALVRLAGRISKKVEKLADELDQAVGDWKFGSWGQPQED